jgi:ubiquinone/menaquinone biosynthesis C-methylase UbiE
MRWTSRQDEVLALLDVRPGDRVLEVGYGPGAMIRLLVEQTRAATICGVDLSPSMREAAAKYNRRAVEAGRVDLRVGAADATGFDAASFDRVVSVNNVALWPDLDAGLDELRRVARPGAVVLVAWHGGRATSRVARSLALPEDKLERIRAALAARFTEVTRHELTNQVVFRAVR